MEKKTVCVVVFLAAVSIVCGLKGGLVYANEPEYGPKPPVGFDSPDKKGREGDLRKRDEIFANISKRLNLNEKQQEKVKAILESSRKEAMGIIESSKEKLVTLKDKTNKQIKSQLSKKQQVEFDKMVEEGRARVAKWLSKRASLMKPKGPRLEGQEIDTPPMPPEGYQED